MVPGSGASAPVPGSASAAHGTVTEAGTDGVRHGYAEPDTDGSYAANRLATSSQLTTFHQAAR